MTNGIGPMDQGSIGKLGNKVDDTGAAQKIRDDKASAEPTAQDRTGSSDVVELTSRAKLMERLETTMASAPDIDSARVAEVKAAIANGDYQIDSEAIANAMLLFEKSLGD